MTVQTAPTQGFYTIVLEDDSHVTLRLKEPDRSYFDGLELGTLVAAYFRGKANDRDSAYKQFAFVFPSGRYAVWKRFQDDEYERQQRALHILLNDDPDEWSREYSLRSGRCCKCNRLLTNPDSIQAGIGPVCSHNA